VYFLCMTYLLIDILLRMNLRLFDIFQFKNPHHKVVAFVFGDRIHISEVAATATNESIVRFLGNFHNSQEQCEKTVIQVTHSVPGALEFNVSVRTSDEQHYVLPSKFLKC